MIIGIDCDEVLCSTMVELVKYPEFKGTKWNSFYSYTPPKAPGFSMSIEGLIESYRKLLTGDEFWNIKPVKGALEKIKKLKEKGHELIVVTGRSSYSEERTKKWVEKNYPNMFSDFVFAGTHTNAQKTKAQLCEERGVEVIIEDDPYFASNLSENGIPCILLNYPWNENFDLKSHKNVKRINSRDELDESLF